ATHRRSLQVEASTAAAGPVVCNSTTAISAHTTKSSTPMPNSRQAYYPQLPAHGPIGKHSGKVSRNYPNLAESESRIQEVPENQSSSKNRNIAEQDPDNFVRLLSTRLQVLSCDEPSKSVPLPPIPTNPDDDDSSQVTSAKTEQSGETTKQCSDDRKSNTSTSTATSIFQAPWVGRLLAAAQTSVPEQENPQVNYATIL
ncbi:hypothetical protein Ciccas_013535, partial [Cichlidogyrus casuarinus]